MKSSGNSNPETCVQNLCSLVRGEVYGDRVRGVDGSLIDRNNVSEELVEDIKWLVKTYEPRVDAEDVVVSPSDADNGDFIVEIKTKKRGE